MAAFVALPEAGGNPSTSGLVTGELPLLNYLSMSDPQRNPWGIAIYSQPV